MEQETLALHGGPKVRAQPWPERGLIGPEEKAAVDALFDQAIATGRAFGYNGPEEEAYCREFSDYLGGGFADAVSSGSAAVYVALKALNLPPFSEVIVSEPATALSLQHEIESLFSAFIGLPCPTNKTGIGSVFCHRSACCPSALRSMFLRFDQRV